MRVLSLLIVLVLTAAPAMAQDVRVAVRGERFEIVAGDRTLGAEALAGAVVEIEEAGRPLTVRIDAVEPAAERPSVPLLHLSVLDAATGAWRPYCQADAKGRRAGFPVAGRWNADGRYRRALDDFFIACSSGARGKCILWGYDPWTPGPQGEDLAPYYEACTRLVRADYDGRSAPFTRNGTTIDMWDDAGVQSPETLTDPSFHFEAGWGPHGAVCVAKTRYTDLLPLAVLLESRPALGGPCDEAEARRRGAILFNRSR